MSPPPLTCPRRVRILAGMSRFVLDSLYAMGLVATSPMWLYRMLRHGRYRRGLAGRMGRTPVRHGLQPVVWIHAVSLGEVNGIRTLVDALSGQLPDYEIVVSSTTDTGMDQARKLFAPDRRVFQFPMDFSLAVGRAFRRLRPDLVVLMEGEIWPNFLGEANRRGVPVIVVNGRMSQNKGYPRYRLVKPLVGRMFNRLAAIAVQEPAYADRFALLGTRREKLRVTGTMKFDTALVADRVPGQDELAAALGLRGGDRLIVAGGTGDGEEALLLDAFGAMRQAAEVDDRTRLAIVPRKPERFADVARLIEQAGFPVVRRSARPDGTVGGLPDGAVILGDTMGELRRFYALASVIFVGRTLVPLGGSDMIEAAALGKPVAFGPHAFNFPQARLLIEARAARRVADVAELRTVLAGWLADPAAASELGQRAQAFVRSQQGATQRNVELICEVLGREPARREGGIATRRLEPPGGQSA